MSNRYMLEVISYTELVVADVANLKFQQVVTIFTHRPHIEDVTNMCHAMMARQHPATAFGRNYNF